MPLDNHRCDLYTHATFLGQRDGGNKTARTGEILGTTIPVTMRTHTSVTITSYTQRRISHCHYDRLPLLAMLLPGTDGFTSLQGMQCHVETLLGSPRRERKSPRASWDLNWQPYD